MNFNDDDPIDTAVYATVHNFKDSRGRKGVPAIANMLGLRKGTVQNKANPREEFAHFTVKEARALMLATGDHQILYAMARDVGEACVPLPSFAFGSDMDMLNAWAEWQADLGETAKVIDGALKDGKITQQELKEVHDEIVEDFEKALAMLDVLKSMAEPEEGASNG